MGVGAAVAGEDVGEADGDDDGDAFWAWIVTLAKLRASNAVTTIDGLEKLVMVCRKNGLQITDDQLQMAA
jgi:hypothetical protein